MEPINPIILYSLFENLHDVPEAYVDHALNKIKRRLELMFKPSDDLLNPDEFNDDEKRKKGAISVKDLNLTLQSLELSKFSKSYDNVKLIMSDDKYRYDLTITIDLKDAVPSPEMDDKDFSDKDISICQIRFKKYDIAVPHLVSSLPVKTLKMKDIDEEFLVKLKIELDDDETN